MDAMRGWARIDESWRRAGVAVALTGILVAGLIPAGAGPAQAAAGPVTPANITLSLPAGKINPFGFSSQGVGVVTWSASALPPGLSIDPATGIVSGRALQAQPLTTYTITATDSADGGSSSTTLTMGIQATLLAPATSIVGAVGVPLESTYVFVVDGFIAPTFSLTGHPAWLSIDADGVLTGTPTSATASPMIVTVTATDVTGMSAVTSFSLTVAATALSPASQTITARVGSALVPSGASFPSGADLTYTTTPDLSAETGLSFSAANGAISGTPTKPIPVTAFLVQQRSAASNEILAESTASVQIDGNLGAAATPLQVSSGVDMTPVAPFGPAAAQVAGLVGTVTFSVTPALASGLLIDAATGTISGTPVVAGSVEHTITATDSRGVRATGKVTISVGGSLVPVMQTITGSVGTNLSSATLSITGMRPPLTFTMSPLPPGGLQFDTATGVLSGIPTTPAITTFYTITATDALGAKATSTLVLTIAKSNLAVPVIGSVTGGPQIGSLIVYFARPTSAPPGQKFTIKVYDSTGATLVTSVPALTSPATVTGLIAGETYSVIVVADATASAEAVESLPKLGTASDSTTAQAVSFSTGSTAGTLNGTSTSFVSPSVALGKVGITLASTAQGSRTSKAFGTRPPSAIRSQAPKIKVPVNSFVTIVLPDVRVRGRIQVHIYVRNAWIDLGYIRATSSGQLAVPALRSTRAGTFLVRFTPRAGRAGYIKVIFDDSGSGGFGASTAGGF